MAPGFADHRLAVAIGLALTGERLGLAGSEPLGEELAAAGYDLAELHRVREERQLHHEAWPFPVPLEERSAVGFARFDAALAEARVELGLTGLSAAKPAHRPLNRDEQRLQAERPPHW